MPVNETITLGQVEDLMRSGPRNKDLLVHIYGTFVKDEKGNSGCWWALIDETVVKAVEVKLSSSVENYTTHYPGPGDTVRIHRLRINPSLHRAEITMPRNVVVWRNFEHNSKPLSIARRPSLTDDDEKRREELEVNFITTRITAIRAIKDDRSSAGLIYNVYGCVEEKTFDQFGHIIIGFTDGTDSLALRVFCKGKGKGNGNGNGKENVLEDETHFELASKLKAGQYFVATHVKCDPQKRLNLSANLRDGRSLRIVDPSSKLGTRLCEALRRESNADSTGSQPRRSERLHQQDRDDTRQTEEPISVDDEPPQVAESLPPYTLYSNIQRNVHGFEYYDIVGIVKSEPRTTTRYNHCVIQIFDGSCHEFTNFFAHEVESVMPGCLVVQVYSAQRESDTDEHFQKAMALQVGDLVYITNVKITFPDGLIKPELNSNKSHHKSIKVIDKRSSFGIKITDMVENPNCSDLTQRIVDPSEASAEDNPFQDP